MSYHHIRQILTYFYNRKELLEIKIYVVFRPRSFLHSFLRNTYFLYFSLLSGFGRHTNFNHYPLAEKSWVIKRNNFMTS